MPDAGAPPRIRVASQRHVIIQPQRQPGRLPSGIYLPMMEADVAVAGTVITLGYAAYMELNGMGSGEFVERVGPGTRVLIAKYEGRSFRLSRNAPWLYAVDAGDLLAVLSR